MTEAELMLWNKIEAFELDNPEASFSFTNRLSRENGWSMEYTLRVIEEYKKFIFLSVITETSLTPSDQVDQAWHLHLIYTRSYWENFCEDTLNRKVHHGPTNGGIKEGEKYVLLYQQTLDLYLRMFGHLAPEDIWPETNKRFTEVRFQRVNLHTHRVSKRNRFF